MLLLLVFVYMGGVNSPLKKFSVLFYVVGFALQPRRFLLGLVPLLTAVLCHLYVVLSHQGS